MPWFYEQRSGRIWRNNEPVLATGYSGAPGAINDPTQQHKIGIGPIPRGVYRILNAISHEKLGPVCMRLVPDAGNEMFGRDPFLIHGDNPRRNQSASEGCIILDRPSREAINKSTDKTLVVV